MKTTAEKFIARWLRAAGNTRVELKPNLIRSLTCTVLVLCSYSQAAERPDPDEWQSAGSWVLLPGERVLIIIEQRGVDLEVQVQQSDVVTVQDAPDGRLGSEVVAIENLSAQSMQFAVAVRRLLLGMPTDYEVRAVHQPERTCFAIAQAIMAASQDWYKRKPNGQVLGPLPNQATHCSLELQRLLVKFRIEAHIATGEYGIARTLLDDVDSRLHESAPNDLWAVWVPWTQALVRWYSNSPRNAISYATTASNRIEDMLDDKPYDIRYRQTKQLVQTTLGALQFIAGRAAGDSDLMARGGALLQQAYESSTSFPDLAARARVIEYLALHKQLTLGRGNSASLQAMREAEDLYRQAQSWGELAAVLNNQAFTELGRGNLGAARNLYLRALQHSFDSRHLEGRAHIEARLGFIFHLTGDLLRAERYLQDSIESYRILGVASKLLHNQLELLTVLQSGKRDENALTLVREIASTLNLATPLEDQIRVFTKLALLEATTGQKEAANRALTRALSLRREAMPQSGKLEMSTVRLPYLLDLEIVKAEFQAGVDNWTGVNDIVANALQQIPENAPTPVQELRLRHLAILSAFAQGDVERGFAMGGQALQFIDQVRQRLDIISQTAGWGTRSANVIDTLITAYLKQYIIHSSRDDLDQALALIARYRNLGLRELRAQRHLYAPSEHLEAAVSAKRDRILTPSEALNSADQRGVYDLELNRGLLLSERAGPATNSLSQFQGRLTNEQVYLGYHLFEPNSFLLLVNKDSADVYQLPGELELTTLIENSGVSDGYSSQRLAQALLPTKAIAFLTSVQNPHLLLDIHGVLQRVPFTNLPINDRKLLLDIAALERIETISNEAIQNRPSNPLRLELAIFADPKFVANADTELGEWHSRLEPLPHTAKEAQEIVALFEPQAAVSFLGKQANRANFLQESIRQAKILHIATHGFASADDELYMGLALASENDGANADASLLTVDEINAYRFENDLVVIAGCDTATGKVLKGEGALSLSRAFLSRGAQSTLATLWPVSDRATAIFMHHFYTALKLLEQSPARALQYAQRKMRLERRYRNPYYWAPFVLNSLG